MKKIIKFFTLMFLSTVFMINVNASSGSIKVTSSANQVIVGNKVTVYVTVSSNVALGTWEYTLNYNNSIFKYVSSDVSLHYADVASNANTKSVQYKYVFQALKSGSASFYIDSSNAYGFDDSHMSISNGSKTIKAITYDEYQASLSSNNNLKNLSIDGYELNPEFDKDTFEYTVKVSEKEESVRIVAVPEDKKATVNGAGEVEVSAGSNQVDIVVLAENGSEKTYKIFIEVLDKDPINVEIGDKNYTVVKVAKNLTKPESFIESTLTIEEKEVPAFYSEILEINLVGLKDEEGNISLFIYKDDHYEEYTELQFGFLTVYVLKDIEQLHGYEKLNTMIQGHEVISLKQSASSRYSIIKAINVENKEEGLYLYDAKDNSLIKFDEESFRNNQEKMLILLLCNAIFAVVAFFALVLLITKKKSKKTIKKEKKVERKSKAKVLKEKSSKENVNEIREIDDDFKDIK